MFVWNAQHDRKITYIRAMKHGGESEAFHSGANDM